MEVITIAVRIADKLGQFNDGDYMLVDASAVEYKQTDGSSISVQQALENSVELTKEGVEGLLGLTKEEIEAMTDLILDTEVRIDKTYSSSKIHADIQQCLEDSKTYTLEELGKKIGASYEVVASTDDMVSQDRLYLLNNGNNYDIYIVDVDNVPVVIGDTSIDLSGYVTKTEIESELGTERLGTTSQTVKGAINELFQSVTNEGDITDLENRVTTNEANITGLQEQIDNLDIPDITDLENASKVYCDIAEINNAKGTNISLVVGEDNTEKIMNVLAPNEVFANWFNNESAYDRFGINSNIGTRINLISIQKYHDNNGVVIAITNKGKVLSRYMRNNILSKWDYDTTDLTGINDKLTQLENKANSSILKFPYWNGSTEVYLKIPSPTTLSKQSPFITVTSSHGGCIVILAGDSNNTYSFTKCIRLSNDNIFSHNATVVGTQKLLNVYVDKVNGYIYVKLGANGSVGIMGINETPVSVTSLPTGTTEVPILDLTQGSTTDLSEVNNRLSKLESKRVYNSIEELNSAKGLSLSFTNGEDNTMKIIEVLSPVETFADYFDNSSINNRFGIDTNTYGSGIRCLIITKFNNFNACARAYMSSGKILIRQYANGSLQTGWSYDGGVDLTGINTRLTQVENKATLIPVVADNPTDKDLNNYKENGNYSIGISSNYSNVPEVSSGLLTVIRANTYRLQIYTVLNNNNVYFRKSSDWGNSWSSWALLNDSSGGSGNGTNNDVYTTEEQAVGTWINGKTLYRRTIEDNTLRETGTDMIKLFNYNTNMKIVKFEGVVTLANANGQTFIRSLPYNKDGEEIYITKTTLDTLRLDSYLTNYKLGGYIVSVYYYKV